MTTVAKVLDRPRRRQVRRLPLVPYAVAAALLAVGCGSGSDPVRTVVAASIRTLSQTAGASLTLTGPGVISAGRAPVLGRAASRFTEGTGFEAIDVPGIAGRPGGRLYLDFLPGSVYLRPISATSIALPGGKSWVFAPLTSAVDRRFPRFVLQVEALSPQLLLDEIAWGAESVASTRQEVVNHVPFRKYQVSVSLVRALAAAKGPGAAAMRVAIQDELNVLRSTRGRQASTVPVTVWLDGPGHVAQLQADLPGSGLGHVGFVLSGYGVAVNGSPAEASLLTDLRSVLAPGSSPLASAVVTS